MESRAAVAAAAVAAASEGGQQQQQQQRIVNICFSYTSSQELAAAAGQLQAGLTESELLPDDVTPGLLHRVMHTQVRKRERQREGQLPCLKEDAFQRSGVHLACVHTPLAHAQELPPR